MLDVTHDDLSLSSLYQLWSRLRPGGVVLGPHHFGICHLLLFGHLYLQMCAQSQGGVVQRMGRRTGSGTGSLSDRVQQWGKLGWTERLLFPQGNSRLSAPEEINESSQIQSGLSSEPGGR